MHCALKGVPVCPLHLPLHEVCATDCIASWVGSELPKDLVAVICEGVLPSHCSSHLIIRMLVALDCFSFL